MEQYAALFILGITSAPPNAEFVTEKQGDLHKHLACWFNRITGHVESLPEMAKHVMVESV